MEERIDPIEETEIPVEESVTVVAADAIVAPETVLVEETATLVDAAESITEPLIAPDTVTEARHEEPVVAPETVTQTVPEEPVVAEETPVEVTTTSDPIPTEQPVTEPVQAVETTPVVTDTTATVTEAPTPGYGSPQMLYEDFIPYEYLHETAPTTGTTEETATASDPAPETQEGRRKKRKPSREDELLAAVEEAMASRDAQTATQQTPQETPTTAVTQEPAPQERPVTATQAPTTQSPITVAPVVAVGTGRQEADMAEQPTTGTTPQVREYTRQEKKLRRKYKLDKDVLLGNNDLIPGFILAKGEHVVRCYECLNSRKGDGMLCLTNKRLLINADERSEVAVEDIAGIKFAKNTFFSFARLLFALIFFGLGAFMIALPFVHTGMNIPFITGDSWKSWFFYLFIACGAVSVLISLPLWMKMVRKYFYFSIYVRDSAPFLECKSASFVKGEKKGTQYSFILSTAGKESEKAARELGALLIEVKEGRYNR